VIRGAVAGPQPTGYALVVPGQGSQRPGVLHQLGGERGAADALDQAGAWTEARLGRSLDDLDTARTLGGPVGAQLALVIAGVASGRAVTAVLGPPAAVAGHSVGGFAAAVLAGALPLAAALDLVHLRATAMAQLFPTGHGMVAVWGVGEREAGALAERHARPSEPLWVANLNSDDQVVLGGSDAAFDRLEHDPGPGASRTERLAVPVPSHGEPLRPVAVQLGGAMAHLDVLALHAPALGVAGLDQTGGGDALAVPWASTVSGQLLRRPDQVRADLADSVARTVRWRDVVATLLELGICPLVQTQPGDVLARLARGDHGPVAVAHAEVATDELPLAVARLAR
jgi:malonate decarboxylase epsilon subunit